MLIALAAGTGVVLSQGAPGLQTHPQPCTAHPCDMYAYVAHYDLADGRINAITTWDLNLEGPVQAGAAFAPRPGMGSVVIADPAGRQMLKDLFANANGQDYYIDLVSLTLKKRAGSVPVPSVTAESAAFGSNALGVVPSIALVAGIGMAVVVMARTRKTGAP